MRHEAGSRFTNGKAHQSGLLLLSENLDAFAARGLSARKASRSLDLMYYLWHDDLTGRLLASEVLKAADRGVRVRLLLDDINPIGNDSSYLALNSHPNIEVRLFNASHRWPWPIDRAVDMIMRGFALMRRMHNKAWIVDQTTAIVGGRNIGDAYFDAADTNFRDLDVLLSGDGVQQTQAIFEDFWKNKAAARINRLTSRRPPDLAEFRLKLARLADSDEARPYLDRVRRHVSVAAMATANGGMHQSRDVRVISDPPDKVRGRKRQNWLMKALLPLIESSQETLEIISPYFIPGAKGVAQLAGLVDKGVAVSILTNSLAATDVAAVHGAYANYRVALLKSRIELFELQPFDRNGGISVFGSKGASLHTKAFTVDGNAGFIGSFNFDPRSVSINTEMGVVFVQKALVGEMRRLFRQETSSRSSYRLSLDQGRLRWQGEVDGTNQAFFGEPEAGIGRRVLAKIISWLPIESQL